LGLLVIFGVWMVHKLRKASKAVIVHPSYLHTLNVPPSTTRHSFLDLPVHCVHLIASNLDDARDLLRLQSLCSASRYAANDDLLWKDLCMSKFSVPEDSNPPSWKELYKFNHEFLHKVVLSCATDRLMQTRLGGLSRGMAFQIPVLA
jgi:hypothetical protein